MCIHHVYSKRIIDFVCIVVEIIDKLKHMIVEVFRAIALSSQLNAGSSRLTVNLRFYIADNSSGNIGRRQLIARHRFFQRIKVLQLQFIGSFRTCYRTQGSHGTVVQRMYITISFVQTDRGIVPQSQIIHIVYKVICKRQKIGSIDLPV